MKSAGKARNNGLYRHIRTSKEIIRNLLNDYINNFNQIPSLVSIDTHNKAKLVELIDFFDSFPLLFNGERIR